MCAVKIGAVGLMGRGSYLAGIYHNPPETEVVALCDCNEAAFDFHPERMNGINARRYLSSSEMYKKEKLDWILLATPDRTHHQLILEALRAGVNVFAEKPMAQTIDECDEICRVCRETGKIIVVGCELRFAAPVVKFRELLRGGAIGRIIHGYCVDSIERGFSYFLRDYRQKKWSNGLLMQKGVHSLDLINDLIDSMPVRVFADGGLDYFGQDEAMRGKHCRDCERKDTCPDGAYQIPSWKGDFLEKGEHARDHCVYDPEADVEDNTAVIINYASGARVTYSEIHFAPEYKREFHFIGTEGRASLVMDQTPVKDEKVNLHESGREVSITITKRRERTVEVPVEMPTGGHWGADDRMRDAVLEAMVGRKQIEPGPRAGRDAVAIAYAALKSIESGLPYGIKPL
jgi:predicted dehydrogenase